MAEKKKKTGKHEKVSGEGEGCSITDDDNDDDDHTITISWCFYLLTALLSITKTKLRNDSYETATEEIPLKLN